MNESTTVKPRVGIIGLGIMGMAVAKNAQSAGFPVTVYNRSEGPRQEAKASGLSVAPSLKEVAQASDVIVTLVTGPPELRAVLSGPDGILTANVNGKTWIQSSTVDHASTLEFAAAAELNGMHFLDCPVAGSRKQVEAAQLILLVGGEAALLEKWQPLLLSIGKAVVHAGPVGKGTALKLCMNLIVAQMTTTLCEAVELARRQDLDPKRIFDVIDQSPALNCDYFKIKESALLNQDFRPAFSLDNMLKDIRFMDEAARAAGMELPVTHAVRSLMETASAAGWGGEDLTALIKALEPAERRAR